MPGLVGIAFGGVESHRESATEVVRQFRRVRQVRGHELLDQSIAGLILFQHGCAAAREIAPKVRVPFGNIPGPDVPTFVPGRRHGPEVVVVVQQDANIFVRVLHRFVLRPGPPPVRCRRVVRYPHLRDHVRQRRLDSVVVNQMPYLLVRGVASDVAHVVRVAHRRAFVCPQVLHAEVRGPSESLAHRPIQILFCVEENHRRLAVRHGVGDGALVVTVGRAWKVRQ